MSVLSFIGHGGGPLHRAVPTLSPHTHAVLLVGQVGGVHGIIGVVCCLPVETGDIARDASEVLKASFWCHVLARAGVLGDLDLPLPGDPGHLPQGQGGGQDRIR